MIAEKYLYFLSSLLTVDPHVPLPLMPLERAPYLLLPSRAAWCSESPGYLDRAPFPIGHLNKAVTLFLFQVADCTYRPPMLLYVQDCDRSRYALDGCTHLLLQCCHFRPAALPLNDPV